jgi:hypothetical protein
MALPAGVTASGQYVILEITPDMFRLSSSGAYENFGTVLSVGVEVTNADAAEGNQLFFKNPTLFSPYDTDEDVFVIVHQSDIQFLYTPV